MIQRRAAVASYTRSNRFLAIATGLCLLPATTATCSQYPFLAASTIATATTTTMNDTDKKELQKSRVSSYSKDNMPCDKNNHEEDNIDNHNDDYEGDDDPWSKIGGGAINEKKRRFPPVGAVAATKDDTTTTTTSSEQSDISHYFDPTVHKAHLWHALEGLDRYPNYLSRWNNVEDMNRLEEALKERLAQVQQQRHDIMERRAQIQKLVQELVVASSSSSNDCEASELHDDTSWKWLVQGPTSWQQVQDRVLDARMSKAIFKSKMFQASSVMSSSSSPPTLAQVLSGNVAVELDAGMLQIVMEEEVYDVYSLPLLSPDFCHQVREYIKAFTKLAQERASPELNIGLRPIDLDTVGLQWINDLLFHLVVRPISRHLFLKTETWKDLDWRQGYIAAYAARPSTDKPRERLVTHTDDSEVTLNVCLGEPDYVGGHVEFRNLRGAKMTTNSGLEQEAGQLLGMVQRPNVGTALIHAGRHFHTVTRVESGNRFALIVWARSWQGVRAQQCPCCWLNRRPGSVQQEGNDCVCGTRWN